MVSAVRTPVARTVAIRALAAALFAALAAPALAGPRLLFKADFNDKPVDQLLASRGPAFNEPVSNDSGFVRHAPFDSPHLQIMDTSACCAQSTVFEFWNFASISTGTIDFRAKIYFDALVDNYILSLREQGGSAVSFLNTYARRTTNAEGNGNLLLFAGDTSTGLLPNPGYPVGRWVPLHVSYSPNLKRVRMEVDSKRVFEGPFSINATVGVGRFYFASENNAAIRGGVPLTGGATAVRTVSIRRTIDVATLSCPTGAGPPCMYRPVRRMRSSHDHRRCAAAVAVHRQFADRQAEEAAPDPRQLVRPGLSR